MGTPTRETDAQRQARTLKARRNARFTFAERRIRHIAAGDPPLSDDQVAALAAILRERRPLAER